MPPNGVGTGRIFGPRIPHRTAVGLPRQLHPPAGSAAIPAGGFRTRRRSPEMVTATQTKMVTGKINSQEVTVPQGTFILEAARLNGIEIPNLCYQPLLRPWGSCRICTVEILGKRGGLIESCTTPLAEGMEVLTHSPEVVQARQYILQMYLIDHALDCPTCDKSGECYLQDNTYLHNINANPYRRPKLAQPYEHFSATIDYKWDRCIMCNRCTRVCDEVIGVVAIESANRSLEATITPAFGMDLSETDCTNCGMCIAVCPVGALTDRHFGHHPWELDTTETICGFCDVGCTLNVESNKGIVRRTTHLWERGVNHGYTCEAGKWGHEEIQSRGPELLPPRQGPGRRLLRSDLGRGARPGGRCPPAISRRHLRRPHLRREHQRGDLYPPAVLPGRHAEQLGGSPPHPGAGRRRACHARRVGPRCRLHQQHAGAVLGGQEPDCGGTFHLREGANRVLLDQSRAPLPRGPDHRHHHRALPALRSRRALDQAKPGHHRPGGQRDRQRGPSAGPGVRGRRRDRRLPGVAGPDRQRQPRP